MITIPICIFVILVTLSLLFIALFTFFVLCLMKINNNNDKEWEKIVEETYKKKNWENEDK